MHKHSSPGRGNVFSVNKSLWPDCAINVDPYRLPAHIDFEVPSPAFSSVPVNRTVSIYSGFVVITDRLAQHSTTMRIVALADFDAVVVRVGFSAHGYRQIGSAVYLHHGRLGLELPLYSATDCEETAAFWLAWSRVLGVPAMSVGADGDLTDPFERMGKLHIGSVLSRRTIAGATACRPVLRRQSARQQRRMVEANVSTADARSAVMPQKNGSNIYRLFCQQGK